jgi:hypothetical protein
MSITIDPRSLAVDARFKLHRVQMPPSAFFQMVVDLAKTPAFRASKPGSPIVPNPNQHPLGIKLKLHLLHLPR